MLISLLLFTFELKAFRHPRASAAPRPQPFTDLVRRQAADEPVDAARLAAVREALRQALRRELRQRGLWESPPAYLGVQGWESWQQPAAGQGGAFAELLEDCYTFVFVDRLRSMRAQLAVKDNIEGLVLLNIRHFLHERQRTHDPLGYRVFEVVWAAVERGVAAGTLEVVDGDPRIRNDTLLAFDPDALHPPAAPAALEDWAARVGDDLLPDLVTATGRRQEETAAEIALRLARLRQAGVVAFRFKALVDAFKRDVRQRWAAILSGEGGGGIDRREDAEGGAVWMEAPGARFEAQESFRALVACVLRSLARLEAPARTRAQLATLWQYLRLYSVEGLDPEAEEEEAPAAPAKKRRLRAGRPSDRMLADRLKIPREQLPQLFATLGGLVAGCRASGAVPGPRRWDAAEQGPA